MNAEIARTALTHYGLPDAQVTFLGRSQNTTFRVEIPTGDKFLLRFHSGIEVAGDSLRSFWREPHVIQSELLWLNAIAHKTEITVPQPVRNRSGEWVTNIASTEFGSSIFCSLLRWVEGEHVDGEPTVQQVRRLGMVMAQLHQHSSNWSLPPGFSRPTHSVEQLKAATSQLDVLVQNGTISIDDYQVFQKAAAQVQEFMTGLQHAHDTWGLIHADLHQGNYVLYNNEEVRPIDFSRCGFGFYLYDIGQSLGDLDASLRSPFFEGYTSVRALPADYQGIVEAFFVGATVENFAFLSANPQEHEWLSRAVPYVAKNHLQAYLHGETFLFLK
ncbi:phosphotransferase [Pseudanabaena sp. FACHB-2040]|uniref:phosphotransferase enzyme family protein n=1 Tax=Pseudanabaena sp. FACHB-2040 TaxID=2692859 RepID=UPI001682BC2F|nr:phosphotransferase [Pseudanabaena sp. FACHB-2040]MBD2256063.1 phosphotransferase [Pseudanabaena sp. FACHB-2040]